MNKYLMLLLLLLVACGGNGGDSPPPPPPPDIVTIPDVKIYLAQTRCPNGEPGFRCSNPIPQRQSDPMYFRRIDWPLPGYQIEDSIVSDGGDFWIVTWSYPPFGGFKVGNGDGGEIYVVDGGVVKIWGTQDGGKPGELQKFTNWWLFDNKTPSGSWRMGNEKSRARREMVTFPASGFGINSITSDTIISEHFDHLNLDGKMERIYLSKDWGRILWQAWGPVNPWIAGNLKERCPSVSYDGPPSERPDWVLLDCRLMTNLVKSDGGLSVKSFGWPGDGFKP